MKVNSVTLSVFVHETEDEGKIDSSLRSFFSPYLGDLTPTTSKVEGHFGDSLVIYKYYWKGKGAKEVFHYLITSLPDLDRAALRKSLNAHIQGSKLHFRLDKQIMVLHRRVRLSQGDDVIKVVVSFSAFNSKELEEVLSGGSS
ncbi:hypothetical protein HS1genome_0262 [Sulfodiicoccus acidiphilus]|uniref:Exosome protein n=1 Tax=Sulfodiicoccus acidiphilus TaxID=1670455 RepID=A0A348B121_9CREN|nr:RNA-binding domain-containing protein [Sulfodiicoccus acidiphilus]BBD71873.1 hypothetical protein HS1genome_0262 [Sulfodiicoccus acidiphilus]GGT91121.1 hypothetical protein GCM10007116_06030 [Sulfodiicoccus acidiphilus]